MIAGATLAKFISGSGAYYRTASSQPDCCKCVGLARTMYLRCVYGIFGWEITLNTVIYGVYLYGSGQPYKCDARAAVSCVRVQLCLVCACSCALVYVCT